MRRLSRNYGYREIAGALIVAILFFSIGYLGGKFRAIGQIRDSVTESFMGPKVDIPYLIA